MNCSAGTAEKTELELQIELSSVGAPQLLVMVETRFYVSESTSTSGAL